MALPSKRYEIYKDEAEPKKWRWRLKVYGYGIIATSHQPFKKWEECFHEMCVVKEHAADAPAYDISNPKEIIGLECS